MKIILLVLILLKQSLQQFGFFFGHDDFQKPYSPCEDIAVTGDWTGLYFKFQPQTNNYCLFTFSGQSSIIFNGMKQEFDPELVYAEENQSGFCNLRLNSSYKHYCYNSLIETQYNIYGQNQSHSLLGFGNNQLIMGQEAIEDETKFQQSKYTFSGQVQIKPYIQTSDFQIQLGRVLDSIKYYGFGSSTCKDLNGYYFGRILQTRTYNMSKPVICLYQIWAEIEVSSYGISVNIYQQGDAQKTGSGPNVCYDFQKVRYNMDCNSAKQYLNNNNDQSDFIIGGIFNQGMAIINIFSQDPQTIVLSKKYY